MIHLSNTLLHSVGLFFLTFALYFIYAECICCFVKFRSEGAVCNPLQIVGMSATLPNLNVIAHWLDADLYRTDFRPVPLTELVKVGGDIFDSTVTTCLRCIAPSGGHGNSDDGDVVPLCLETVADGCSVLIFCPTKNWCEKLADSVAREFYRLLHEFRIQGAGIHLHFFVSGQCSTIVRSWI